MPKPRHLITATLSLILLSACSNTPKTSSPPPPPGSSIEVSNQIPVFASTTSQIQTLCDIITEAEISKIVGTQMTEDRTFLPNQDEVTKGCNYRKGNEGGLNIITSYDNESRSAKDAYEEVVTIQKDNPNYKDVTDVGEKAFAWNNDYLIQLNAYKKNVWLTMTVSMDNVDKLDIAKKVANLVFDKI